MTDQNGGIVLLDDKAAKKFTRDIQKGDPDTKIEIVDMSKSKSLKAAKIAGELNPATRGALNLSGVKDINTNITFEQRIGQNDIITGQRATPLIQVIDQYFPDVKIANPDVKTQIYVETDGTNQIVRIETLDAAHDNSYYSPQEGALGHTGRIYEPVRGGKAFQDVTEKARKELPAERTAKAGEGTREVLDQQKENSQTSLEGMPANNPQKSSMDIESLAKTYAELVNSNKVWSWKNILGGTKLTNAQKINIKNEAIKLGLIPKVDMKPNTRFPDFQRAKLVRKVLDLPENMWLLSDYDQFVWLDGKLGGRPQGMTWHHSNIPGKMELVPFGIHNIINHLGGRSPGMWAYNPDVR